MIYTKPIQFRRKDEWRSKIQPTSQVKEQLLKVLKGEPVPAPLMGFTNVINKFYQGRNFKPERNFKSERTFKPERTSQRPSPKKPAKPLISPLIARLPVFKRKPRGRKFKINSQKLFLKFVAVKEAKKHF